MWKTVWCRGLPFYTGQDQDIHATNSTKAISEEHWKNPDAVKQMKDFNKSILVKIGDDVKPEEAYPVPPLSLFEDNEVAQEVTMAEEGASIPDIDDRLAESDLEVTPEPNSKKKRKNQAKGKKNPRKGSQ